METAIGILKGIPLWVLGVFVYGIVMGVKGFSRRSVSLKALWIVPVLFLGLGVSSLLSIVLQVPAVGLLWVLSALGGGLLGWFFLTPNPLEIDRPRLALVLPGSPLVLVLFLSIFLVKFIYGYESSVDPVAAGQPGFLLVIFGLSGLSAGIMTGRTAKLYNEFFQTPETRRS